MGPFGIAVREKLLQDIEAHLAVIERVAQIAAFADPGGWDPGDRKTGKLFDVLCAARACIGDDCDVRLIGDFELFQHRPATFSRIPDGDEEEPHLRILFHHPRPAAAFKLSLAIRTPWCPEVHNGQVGRFDRFDYLLLGGRSSFRQTGGAEKESEADQEEMFHSGG